MSRELEQVFHDAPMRPGIANDGFQRLGRFAARSDVLAQVRGPRRYGAGRRLELTEHGGEKAFAHAARFLRRAAKTALALELAGEPELPALAFVDVGHYADVADEQAARRESRRGAVEHPAVFA